MGEEDAQYYKCETADSPDLTDTKTDNIRRGLSNMIFDTSVTIVIISPLMRQSKWIPWEIKFSLKTTSRVGYKSHRNGIVGVIIVNAKRFFR